MTAPGPTEQILTWLRAIEQQPAELLHALPLLPKELGRLSPDELARCLHSALAQMLVETLDSRETCAFIDKNIQEIFLTQDPSNVSEYEVLSAAAENAFTPWAALAMKGHRGAEDFGVLLSELICFQRLLECWQKLQPERVKPFLAPAMQAIHTALVPSLKTDPHIPDQVANVIDNTLRLQPAGQEDEVAQKMLQNLLMPIAQLGGTSIFEQGNALWPDIMQDDPVLGFAKLHTTLTERPYIVVILQMAAAAQIYAQFGKEQFLTLIDPVHSPLGSWDGWECQYAKLAAVGDEDRAALLGDLHALLQSHLLAASASAREGLRLSQQASDLKTARVFTAPFYAHRHVAAFDGVFAARLLETVGSDDKYGWQHLPLPSPDSVLRPAVSDALNAQPSWALAEILGIHISSLEQLQARLAWLYEDARRGLITGSWAPYFPLVRVQSGKAQQLLEQLQVAPQQINARFGRIVGSGYVALSAGLSPTKDTRRQQEMAIVPIMLEDKYGFCLLIDTPELPSAIMSGPACSIDPTCDVSKWYAGFPPAKTQVISLASLRKLRAQPCAHPQTSARIMHSNQGLPYGAVLDCACCGQPRVGAADLHEIEALHELFDSADETALAWYLTVQNAKRLTQGLERTAAIPKLEGYGRYKCLTDIPATAAPRLSHDLSLHEAPEWDIDEQLLL